MKVLVTGGCGYIGSHMCVELLKNNYEIVVLDNLSNSKEDVLNKIKAITNKEFLFYKGSCQNMELLNKIFVENKIDAVMHFAGFKTISKSVKDSLKYYRNNLDSTITLLEEMNKYNCKNLVFSSSATIYGIPKALPIKETDPLMTITPYGTTKFVNERILNDLYESDKNWSIAILRCFNPLGADKSGLIGDDPLGEPNNVMPYIIRVATHKQEYLNVFGKDFDTEDGTSERDYIHILDLVEGHRKALEYVINNKGVDTYNIGSGKCYSVLKLIKTFEEVNNVSINYKYTEKRVGDIATYYADILHAKEKLGFNPTRSLGEMCKDSYNFILKKGN